MIPSPPLRAGFGPKTREYNCHSFDLHISHFYYIQNESDSFGNESPRNSRFTRFRRSYICPDPCTVAGDTRLRSLPGFLFTCFHSPSKYGRSRPILRITGSAAYHRIGNHETSMTTVRSKELNAWLRRNI